MRRGISLDHLLGCREPYHVTTDRRSSIAGHGLREINIDGSLIRDLEGLCAVLSRVIGYRIPPNEDALNDVMRDPCWVSGSEDPKPTVIVIENAHALQKSGYGARDFMSHGGAWAAAWAAGNEYCGPTPLHFIHIVGRDHKQRSRLPQLSIKEVAN